MQVRAASAADLGSVEDTARALLGDPFQAHRRRQFHVTDAEVLVAERDGEPVGFLSWEVDGDWCEVLAIACTARRSGAGTALMAAVATAAVERGCTRVRVVTTDDNTGAHLVRPRRCLPVRNGGEGT